MTWEQNEFNPFYRILKLDYDIDSWFNFVSWQMVFCRKSDKSVCEIDGHQFDWFIQDIVYKSEGNPFIMFGGLRGSDEERKHKFTCLSHKSGAAKKYHDWIKDSLLPNMKQEYPNSPILKSLS